MHEYGIVSTIVNTVLKELSTRNMEPEQVISVNMVAGKLHQIIEENMQFAFEVLTKDTGLSGCRLNIEFKPVRIRCRACGTEGEVSGAFFLCGACQSHDVEVVTGKELYLENLEVRDE